MHNFKELEIWKRSRLFSSLIYNITSKFQDEEKFGLTNQLRRASISVTSNIAEGSSRNSNKEFGRFLEIAIRSYYKIETQLLISLDLKFTLSNEIENLLSELDEIIKMIVRFKSILKI